VLWEPAIGWAVAGVLGGVGLSAAGVAASWIVAGVAVHTAAWIAGEKWFVAGRGLSYGPRDAAASLVREALAPILMVEALSSRAIDWRGTDLGGRWRRRGDGAPEKSV
jgi:hypothetical protein